MDKLEFSVILPFYKQSDHMQAVIDEFVRTLASAGESFEIIAVMNGISELSTEEEVETTVTKPLITKIKLQKGGWGRAVKRGIKAGNGNYLAYTNSARTDPNELLRLLQYAKLSDSVIVKATRVEREDKKRKFVSAIYNLCNRLILKTPIWDVNATPKIIPRKIIDQLTIESDGDSIDAELMYKSSRKNIPSIEIPSNHLLRKGGTSTTNWRSALSMFLGLFLIKMKGAD